MSTYKTNSPSSGPLSESLRPAGMLLACLVGLVISLGIVLAASSAGCSRSDDDGSAATAGGGDLARDRAREPSLEEQVAAVRAGTTDEVRLEQTRAGSAELGQLVGLKGLRTLILDAGSVHDEDVKSLAGLSKLEHLRLRDSPLSDEGLAELSRCGFESLVILNLPQARPTAAGLKELGHLPRIRQLRIGGRQIDDAAVEALTQWPELTSLHLIGPALSDRALETIAGMPRLSSFYLDDCPLSDEAWDQLFRARPTLHVHIDQFHHDRDPRGDH